MRYAITCTLLVGLLNVSVAGEKTGLKVAVKAPGFTLKDQSGKERSLDDFLKKDKVALVFYRSASW